MLSHVTVGTNDTARARAFYDEVLATIGLKRVYDQDDYFAYATGVEELPYFYVVPPFDGGKATYGNGTHFAFLARTRDQVDAFHAAYVRDPDGNKLQAVCYAPD